MFGGEVSFFHPVVLSLFLPLPFAFSPLAILNYSRAMAMAQTRSLIYESELAIKEYQNSNHGPFRHNGAIIRK